MDDTKEMDTMDPESRVPYSTTTENTIWLTALRGADQDNALADLRDLLKRGLHYALGSRLGGDAQFMVEDFVQEGLIHPDRDAGPSK